jgi:hypothetical protein
MNQRAIESRRWDLVVRDCDRGLGGAAFGGRYTLPVLCRLIILGVVVGVLAGGGGALGGVGQQGAKPAATIASAASADTLAGATRVIDELAVAGLETAVLVGAWAEAIAQIDPWDGGASRLEVDRTWTAGGLRVAVRWYDSGRIGKAAGVIIAVIVVQVLIKGVLDTINLIPVIPGLLELLGLVVVGQWSWQNLSTSEKRSAVLNRIQALRKEYLG